jgi:APA family basic amino acid/polyamine antiporter
MKLFPLMPSVFIAAYLFVGISISIADPLAAITGLAVLAAFVCIYFLLHRNKKIVSTTQI